MNRIAYLIFALAVFIADQLSKWAVTELMIRPKLGESFGTSLPLRDWLASAPERLPFTSIEILPFFNIVMVWNKGISFGMFSKSSDYGPILLSLLSLVIVVIFVIWLFRSHSKIQLFSIALVIGGALGNVMDRLRFEAVVDFLDVHAFGYHWPAFNISDSCIVIGVFLLILQSFLFESAEKDAKHEAASPFKRG